MKIEINYAGSGPAFAAKALFLVQAFVTLEGLSRTALAAKLAEAKIEPRAVGEAAWLDANTLHAHDNELRASVALRFDDPIPESWAPEVIADDTKKWCGNALRFGTKHEADRYGSDLFSRWMAVREIRSVPSGDTVNARWKDGHMERI
jgi:hypothetical protein